MNVPGAGDLNKRIAIRTWQDVPNAQMGSDVQYGAPLFVWACVHPVGGAIYYGAQQIGEAVTHRFIVRTGADVTAQHIIEWDDKRFRIRRVNKMAEALHFTVIEVEELGKIQP